MDLSIIIAHYNPGENNSYLNSFYKTLQKIEEQKEKYKVEIIIADDGSLTHKNIINSGTLKYDKDQRAYYHLQGRQLNQWKENNNFYYNSIKHWIYLPKIKPMMSKARIGNISTNIANSKNLFFLDDDNYFLSNNTIHTIISLLKKYSLVIGQIQDNNGRLRHYSSYRVQGTTFAIHKNHFINAGQFGEWTENVSCGVDSDLWWKLYNYFIDKKLKACYTKEIQTIDSCSKRWKSHIKTIFRNQAVKKLFNQIYGCPNYRAKSYNPSRDKKKWLINLS